MKYPPREGDIPQEELMQRAIKETSPGGQWPKATVHFKFTCEHCGERCTLVDDNTLPERGECFVCGKETEIKVGGFMIHYVMKP